jgi:hypothetical protein
MKAIVCPPVAFLFLGTFHVADARPIELMELFGSPGDQLGVSVAGAGDVDGDGFDDIIAGATDGIGNGDEPGAAIVYSGRDGSVLHRFVGESDGDAFGTSVAGAGDVDRDGFDDVIVGARYDDHTAIFSGAVKVYSGATGAELHAFYGDGEGDRLGYSVAGAGDVNGDGFADIVAGAVFDNNNGFWSGSAYVFSGRNGALLRRFDGDSSFDLLGSSVGSAGDVDGDGFDDIIAGAPDSEAGGAGAGLARVYSVRTGAALHTFLGDSASDALGSAVAGVGDVDRDGFDDVAVSAPFDDAAGNDAGTVWVFSGFDGSVLRALRGEAANQLGSSVAGPGDVDGDGFPDIWAGAPHAGGTGNARLYSGRDGSLIYSVDGAPGSAFGISVGAAGDVDGDGFPDLIAGANHDDAGGLDSGRAFVLSGSLTLEAPVPGQAGQRNDFALTRAAPAAPIVVFIASAEGRTVRAIPGCGNVVLDLADSTRVFGSTQAGADGRAELSRVVPPGMAGRTARFQALDRSACRVSNLVKAAF